MHDWPPKPPDDQMPHQPWLFNSTHPEEEPHMRLRWLTWASTLIEGPLAILAPVGNLLTILALWRCPCLRTVANMYIVSLAVADFLVGVLIPWKICLTFAGREVPFDSRMTECLLLNCGFFTLMTSSMLTITVISVDRLLNVRLNLHYHVYITPKLARFVIAAIWIIAFGIGAVPELVSLEDDPSRPLHCHVYLMQREYRFYQLYFQGGIFFLCSVISFICYGYIVLVALRHRRAIAKIVPTQQLGSFHAKAATISNLGQDANGDSTDGDYADTDARKTAENIAEACKAHSIQITDEPETVDSVTTKQLKSDVRSSIGESYSSGIGITPPKCDLSDMPAAPAMTVIPEKKTLPDKTAAGPNPKSTCGPPIPCSFQTSSHNCPGRSTKTNDLTTVLPPDDFSTSGSSAVPSIRVSETEVSEKNLSVQTKLDQKQGLQKPEERHEEKSRENLGVTRHETDSSPGITVEVSTITDTTAISGKDPSVQKTAKKRQQFSMRTAPADHHRHRPAEPGTGSRKKVQIQVTLYFLVFGLFFMLWSPTFLVLLLGIYADGKMAGLQVLFPIGLLNSVCNVAVYAWKCEEMRGSMRRIISCSCSKVAAVFRRK